MDLNNIDISKLPADVRKTFKQLRFFTQRKKIQNKAKNVFYLLKCVYDFVKVPLDTSQKNLINFTGEITRLIVNMPQDYKSNLSSYYQHGWP